MFNIKFIFFTLLFTSLICGDDMQRLESIVKDIAELRADYEECKFELQTKNMQKEMVYDEIKANISTCREENERMKEKLEKQKLILIAKDKEIISLQNKLRTYRENPILTAKACEEKNVFPQLMMKEGLLQEDTFEVKSSTLNLDNEEVIIFTTGTFRVKANTNIYDSPNGKKIDEWEINRSFTSTQKKGTWIQITGYFIDKKWIKATKNMWIEEQDTLKR